MADETRGSAGHPRTDGSLWPRPAASPGEFVAHPAGRWLTGPTYLYACPHPQLYVTVLWGTPSEDALEDLVWLYAAELRAPALRHRSLIDSRRLGGFGPTSFAILERHARTHRHDAADWVEKLAIVRAEGYIGAIAAGFYDTVEAPHPIAVVSSLEEALIWLEQDPALGDQLDRMVEEACELPTLLRDVRRVLDARLPEASIDAVAASLGMAVRTLQRRLREQGTTFRKEQSGAQVRKAKHWLERTDADISRIAFEVGFSTPQHLSALFRRAVGDAPSAWRAARRRPTTEGNGDGSDGS